MISTLFFYIFSLVSLELKSIVCGENIIYIRNKIILVYTNNRHFTDFVNIAHKVNSFDEKGKTLITSCPNIVMI